MINLKFLFIFSLFSYSLNAIGQFTQINTNTQASIHDLALDGDTVLISGNKFTMSSAIQNYLGKIYEHNDQIVQFAPPTLTSHSNHHFQIIQGNYYVMGGDYNNSLSADKIFRSIDKGENWEEIFSTDFDPDVRYSIEALAMLDTTFGIAAGYMSNHHKYFVTQGNDDLWGFGNGNMSSTCTGISTNHDSLIILVTASGGIRTSQDRGQTWYWSSTFMETIAGCAFFGEDSIFCAGRRGADHSAFIKSFDGGITWEMAYIEDPTTSHGSIGEIYDCHFESPQKAWAVGQYGDMCMILETNDFGQNWTRYVLPYEGCFRSLLLVNDTLAYIGGYNGLLLKWDRTIPLTDHLDLIDSVTWTAQLELFPNPTPDFLQLKPPNNVQIFSVTLHDLNGKEIFTSDKNNIENSHFIDLRNIDQGVYLMRINTNRGIFDKKVFKI